MAISSTSGCAENAKHLTARRYEKGESGNPGGKPFRVQPNIRAQISHIVNAMAEKTEEELREIATNKWTGVATRAAAVRLLRMMEMGDLADFEPVMRGEKTLEQLRAEGVNTEVVKKIKIKATRIKKLQGGESPIEGMTGNETSVMEEVTAEIELHDRSGEDFDRVCDQTGGKPTQTQINVSADDTQARDLIADTACDSEVQAVAKKLADRMLESSEN